MDGRYIVTVILKQILFQCVICSLFVGGNLSEERMTTIQSNNDIYIFPFLVSLK